MTIEEFNRQFDSMEIKDMSEKRLYTPEEQMAIAEMRVKLIKRYLDK